MKFTELVRASLLMSLLGSSALFYAQEQHEEAKPPQQEESRPEANKPAREESKPARQDDAKPPKQQQEEAKPSRNEGRAGNQEEVKPSRQEERGDHSQQERGEHSASTQRAGGHIPDDKFRAHFGREHRVVINRPVIVEGQPRFQYSGYWFTIVDPWPAGWAYTDDCYIDYVDGEYFLFDLLHPGVRIAIFVVM